MGKKFHASTMKVIIDHCAVKGLGVTFTPGTITVHAAGTQTTPQPGHRAATDGKTDAERQEGGLTGAELDALENCA